MHEENDREFVVAPKVDIKVRRHPGILSDDHMARIAAGGYEGKEVQAALACIPNGSKIVELGGGIGFVSAVVSKHKSPSSYDLFEANPKMIPVIMDTHSLNGVENVTIHNAVATGDVEAIARGYCEFNIGKTFGASSVMQVAGGGAPIRVKTADINTFLSEKRPDVLIVDIEGAEAGLLTNADISSVEVAIFEVHPNLIGDIGIKSLFDDMSRHGMTYWIRGSRGPCVVFKRVRDHSPS